MSQLQNSTLEKAAKFRKTLSRNEMYTPMTTYEKKQQYSSEETSSATTTTTTTKVPLALREITLTSFLQKVSYQYHRNYATGADPKNTGSRPISQSDVDDRIRQKAVTLMGYGINGSISTTNNISTVASNKKKRPRSNNNNFSQWSGGLIPADNGTLWEASTETKETIRNSTVSYLRQLNQSWNNYIFKVLGLTDTSSSSSNNNNDSINISSTSSPFVPCFEEVSPIQRRWIEVQKCIKDQSNEMPSTIELTGAHVQVLQCSQKRHVVGRMGVLIHETVNTWTVAFDYNKPRPSMANELEESQTTVQQQSKKQQQLKEKRFEQWKKATNMGGIELVLIPKRGSSLDLILPIWEDVESEASAFNELGLTTPSIATSETKDNDKMSVLVPLTERSIYITLTPDNYK